MSGLFDKTSDALGASINFRSLRQEVTSSNIANAETPGYKAKKAGVGGEVLFSIW